MKLFYNAAGCVCVGLAFLGALLPLLPVTPFLLLAAFLFSKGSERLHRWLLTHRTMGPIITDWQKHRVIRTHVKRQIAFAAVLIMVPVLVFCRYPLELKALSALATLIAVTLVYRLPATPSATR